MDLFFSDHFSRSRSYQKCSAAAVAAMSTPLMLENDENEARPQQP
jgi:hypothetical protein